MNVKKIIALGGLLACFLNVSLFSYEAPADESDKAWYYNAEHDEMYFSKKGESYVRGDLKVPLNSPQTIKSYFTDGSLKSLYYETGNSALILDFYPSYVTDRETNLVYASRTYIKIGKNLLLHHYMRIFARDRSLLFISCWQQGVLDGPSLLFDEKGKLKELRNYVRGYPVKEWKQYYPNGAIASTIHFPDSVDAWEQTEDYTANEDLDNSSKSVMSLPYTFPKDVREVWYDLRGNIFKEIHYKVFLQNQEMHVVSTGDVKTWNNQGELISKEESSFGLRKKTSKDSSYGIMYKSEKVWWSKRPYLDKSWSYPIEK